MKRDLRQMIGNKLVLNSPPPPPPPPPPSIFVDDTHV